MWPISRTLPLTLAALAFLPAASAHAAALCKPGFVWREAFSGDVVCVTPATRAMAKQDNAAAASRRSPNGGAFGPDTCRNGFVWREASPTDHVCVAPGVREQTAQDNAAAASRTAIGTANTTYRLSDWSAWMTANDGIRFRYRWGWDPHNPAFATRIDATFELRNMRNAAWKGNARVVTCGANTLGANKDVDLQPNQDLQVTVNVANCGTLAQPFFKGDVSTSATF